MLRLFVSFVETVFDDVIQSWNSTEGRNGW
jgi:hypothetical protein